MKFYTEQDRQWLQNRKAEGMAKEKAFALLDTIKSKPKDQGEEVFSQLVGQQLQKEGITPESVMPQALEQRREKIPTAPDAVVEPMPITKTPFAVKTEQRFAEGAKEGMKQVEEKQKEMTEASQAGEFDGVYGRIQQISENMWLTGQAMFTPILRGLEKSTIEPVMEFVADSPTAQRMLQPAKEGAKVFAEDVKEVLGEEKVAKIEQATGATAEYLIETWNNLDPSMKRKLKNFFGFAEAMQVPALAFGVGAGGATLERSVAKKGAETLGKLETLFSAPVKSVDDVIIQADRVIGETPALVRKTAEAEAPSISIKEKWAGVRPDIKKRIQGKQDELKDYFDVAHARNLDDTLPTPLEHGAKRVEAARDSLKNVLNETGSDIGKFRQKIATIKVGASDATLVEKTFDNSLTSLNLGVKNGKITRLKGKVGGKVSDSEIKLLQSLRDDIQKVKQSPTVENMIDLRNSLDNRINFAKEAREASNVVDPVSRATRSTIKDINLKAIGKEQGQLLEDYSDLIGLYQDLNKYVDGRTGGEFLLKQVLSERGRIPRELMDKLKNYTGIDLMDDATMAQLATEIVGNSAQKGLFRQEITKAGLDAFDIIDVVSGAPGAGMRTTKTLLEKGKGVIAPVEKTFLKAAEQSKAKPPTKPFSKAGEPSTSLTKNPDSATMVSSKTKTMEPLIQEAKKYKSAEEFVEAQGKVTNPYTGISVDEYIAKFGIKDNPTGQRFAETGKNLDSQIAGLSDPKNVIAKGENSLYEMYITRFKGGIENAPKIFVKDKKTGKIASEMNWLGQKEDAFKLTDAEWKKLSPQKKATLEIEFKLKTFYKKTGEIDSLLADDAFNKALYIRTATKPQLTDIWNKANEVKAPLIKAETKTPLKSSLIQEAKKYKSAEEFGSNFLTGFRGRDAKFGKPMTANKETGALYFSESRDVARDFGEMVDQGFFKPNNMVTFADRETLINDYIHKVMSNKEKEWVKFYNEYMGAPEEAFIKFLRKEPKEGVLRNPYDEADNILIPYLKKQGYDALKFESQTLDMPEYVIFDPKQVLTKSQLTDIWKKANEK